MLSLDFTIPQTLYGKVHLLPQGLAVVVVAILDTCVRLLTTGVVSSGLGSIATVLLHPHAHIYPLRISGSKHDEKCSHVHGSACDRIRIRQPNIHLKE